MVTTVGTESTVEKLVTNLLYLEHDAIAAYESTIEKLEDPASKSQIAAFREDHLGHVAELKRMASALGAESPSEGDAKEWLTTGKIALASLVGDSAILKAMRTNEDDTVQAYQQASSNSVASAEARQFFQKAMADEQRHRAWMEQASSR
ncbi:DUF2383 domain-containing protein [Mangrovicella endophytica]|uniref:DUF2383 domain-containing protein n=1 Tax=Mangrovicella endophytica TaxID=2066697 RepID=UPI000C9DE1D1|nr:ferritin-like domain-containing protein [Mangrovicella endophytica]